MQAIKSVGISTQLAGQFEATHFEQGVAGEILLCDNEGEKGADDQSLEYYRPAKGKYLLLSVGFDECGYVNERYGRLTEVGNEIPDLVGKGYQPGQQGAQGHITNQ